MERPGRPETGNRDAEPAEIRNQTKSQIYESLLEHFYLPPKDSKGVNREYLVRVTTNAALTVPLREIKVFEANLTPAQMKKIPFLNPTEAFGRANLLFTQLGYQPFNFPGQIVPEEKWLLFVIRFLDRPNVLGAFLRAVEVPAIFENQPNFIAKIAQRNAMEWLSIGAALENNNFWQLKAGLWEAVKKMRGLEQDIQTAERHMERLRQKRNQEQSILESKRSSFALAIFNVRFPGRNLTAHAAFITDEAARQTIRAIIDM